MTELTTYRASDRRCYNGCPSSDLQREWDHTDNLLKLLQKKDPSARCTYFPAEGKYMVFSGYSPPLEVTGNFHENKQLALIEAIEHLKK